MGLKILTGRGGTIRPTWYGQLMCKGKYHVENLNVPITGTVPRDEMGNVTLAVRGDDAFERSRRAAQKAFDAWRTETKTDPAELAAKAYKARTGVSLDAVPLSKLAELWCARKRKRKNTVRWQTAITAWFNEFSAFAGAFAARRGKRCENVNDITPEIAAAWFDALYETFAWETVTKKMGLLRNAFRIYSTSGRTNPFADIVMQNGDAENSNERNPNGRVNHKPLTAAELERLFEITRGADVYPLIVTAACTGMRIGDVCNLKWADVDLRGGFIDVVTAKKGTRATIPIFERLREVLNELAAVPGDGTRAGQFVFPNAAVQYNAHQKIGADGKPAFDKHGNAIMVDGRDAIYKAAQPYFARAVFGDHPETAQPVTVDADGNADATPRALADVIGTARFTDAKRERLLRVYDAIKAGKRSCDVATELGITRQLVSMHLREIEKLTGEPLRPQANAVRNRKARLDWAEMTRQARGVGVRAASLYGWHSLRGTFVVLAIEAGVPLADVQRVVGHKTTMQTLEYFNPDKRHAAERLREQMRGTVLDGGTAGRKRIGNAAHAVTATTPAPAAPSIDAIIAGMSKRQKQALAKKLFESM